MTVAAKRSPAGHGYARLKENRDGDLESDGARTDEDDRPCQGVPGSGVQKNTDPSIERARTQILESGSFTGLLPAGAYTLGAESFTVIAGTNVPEVLWGP